MKKTLTLTAFVLLAMHCFCGEQLDKISYNKTPLPLVLMVYTNASRTEAIISSEVNKLNSTITLRVGPEVDDKEALKLLEKALLEQARVVVTRLDEKRISITYNDALPVLSKTQNTVR